MKKDNLVFIRHILNSIVDIENFIYKIDEEIFLEEKIYQNAIIYKLQTIGEASRNISEDFKLKYNTINWRKIIAMRNIIVHEYFDVDLWLIWSTATIDIPELKTKILKILNES